MTAAASATGAAADADGAGAPTITGAEHLLAARVVDALLREDYGHLAAHVRRGPDGVFLALPGACGRRVDLEPDGFLADLRVSRDAAGTPLTLDQVFGALDAVADPRDGEGVAAFVGECTKALAAERLREEYRPGVTARLAGVRLTEPTAARGVRGLLWYDALAAGLPHPVYPTAQCRLGFTDADERRYAPEYLPRFELAWVAVPRTAAVRAGDPAPAWWPRPEDVGLPAELRASHDLMPVHPVTGRHLPDEALATVPAPRRRLWVSPTLSTRTVAVLDHPGVHVKLPLAASTLGVRNRRSIAPATLADGALVQQVLTAAQTHAERGDRPPERLLLADDGSYAHAGSPFLGYLLRRYPPGLDGSDVVPLAALLAPLPRCGPHRRDRPRSVIEELARTWFGGDLGALLDAYFGLLFDVHVRLFVRYGIALEAHQQNTALVLDAFGPRLLVKDFDGTLIHHGRLAAALGSDTPAPHAFADDRLLTDSDDALADVFITIVVHLCAAAVAFGLAERGAFPRGEALALLRRALSRALDEHAGSAPAELLRSRLFGAERLPGKAMVTAGTLVEKSRTKARDINKFYGTTGPNYLRS